MTIILERGKFSYQNYIILPVDIDKSIEHSSRFERESFYPEICSKNH